MALTKPGLFITDKLVGHVATRADLAALDTDSLTDGATVHTVGRDAVDDRNGGQFRWDSGDLSSEVTDDPQEGVYIAPDSDATGASGAWARPRTHAGIPSWEFGLRPDDATADSANLTALQAALDYARDHGGGDVLLPYGQIRIDGRAIIRSSATRLVGVGQAGSFNNNDGNANRGSHILYTSTGDAAVIDLGNGTNLFTGIGIRDVTIDAQYNAIGYRLNHGIISGKFEDVRALRTTKGCEVLGTGAITSFGNRWLTCDFEHFTQFGLDIFGDGNESWVAGCKFINTSDNNPTASLRAGFSEILSGLWITFNSFGSTNVDYHIDVTEADEVHIDYNTIEASGNSTAGNEAEYLVRLGLNSSSKTVRGFSVNHNRFLANSKAQFAIRLDDVNGGDIHGNTIYNSFTAGSQISNANAANVSVRRNKTLGGTLMSSNTGLIDLLLEAAGPTYTATNVSTDRTFDADSTNTAELADILGTLIADLQARRIIS